MSRTKLFGAIAGAAGAIALLTIASRVLGFGRWMVQAAAVGPYATGDAYATANVLPNVLYEVVAGGALAGAVVPLLAAPLAKKLRHQVDQVASALLTWALLALVVVGVLVAVLARPIAAALGAPEGADPQTTTAITAYFLLVFSPQIPLYGVGVVLTGVLQAHRRFLAPALVPIASTAVVIVSYVVFGQLAQGLQDQPGQLSHLALAVLAWGTTAGVAALSVPLLIPVLRCGVRLRPQLRFPDGMAARAGRLAAAGLGGVLAQQLAVLVLMLLARRYGVAGTFNVFQYTQAVYLLPYAVLAVPLITVFAPKLAELCHEGATVEFSRLAERSTRTVLAVGLFGAALLVAVAPAARTVFADLAAGTGSGDPVPGMAQALTVMAPGVVGLGLLLHLSRMLLALDRSRAAVLGTVAAWGLTTTTAVIAVIGWHSDDQPQIRTLVALGLGHAIGMSLGAIALVVAVARQQPAAFGRGLGRTLTVGLVSSGVGAIIGRFGADTVLNLSGHSVIAAAMAGLLAVVVVALASGLGVWTFDRAILASVKGAHG